MLALGGHGSAGDDEERDEQQQEGGQHASRHSDSFLAGGLAWQLDRFFDDVLGVEFVNEIAERGEEFNVENHAGWVALLGHDDRLVALAPA